MKKGIIVLLIAVLISGFAFAGTFKGSAGIEFGVDLDTHVWGFANPKTGKYTFKFEFDRSEYKDFAFPTEVQAIPSIKKSFLAYHGYLVRAYSRLMYMVHRS